MGSTGSACLLPHIHLSISIFIFVSCLLASYFLFFITFFPPTAGVDKCAWKTRAILHLLLDGWRGCVCKESLLTFLWHAHFRFEAVCCKTWKDFKCTSESRRKSWSEWVRCLGLFGRKGGEEQTDWTLADSKQNGLQTILHALASRSLCMSGTGSFYWHHYIAHGEKWGSNTEAGWLRFQYWNLRYRTPLLFVVSSLNR